MEEEVAGKGVGLSSKTETLGGEDSTTVEVLGNSVSDVAIAEETKEDNAEKTTVSSDDVEKAGAFTEPDTECDGDARPVKEKLVNGENAGKDKAEVAEKANCEVGDSGGDGSEATTSDGEQNVQTDKSRQSAVDGETLSVTDDKADQEKVSANESDEDNNKMDIDSKPGNEENLGSETNDAKHSETVLEANSAKEICREKETTSVNQEGENGEAMEIDYEDSVEKNVLDSAGNESTQDGPLAEGKGNADMESDLTGTIETADSANPSILTEDAAPGEVEPLDHNGLFDPSSDITNFIDFTGVSSWSGNIQDLKTETRNVSFKEDKKATDMAEEVATEDCNEALKSIGAIPNVESCEKLSSSAEGVENEAATDCPKEASDDILGSDVNREEKDHPSLDKKAADQQETGREEDDTTHEAPNMDPDQTEDTVMEENPNNSDIRTNGLKRKADVLSEDSLGEGRKTVSLAKLSFANRPSFKIGACIARAASQMAGSPSVLKGSNETLSVETFVSQLHCAATDPVKENVVSDIAAEFLVDFRNSSASQQYTPEKVSSKRGKPSNSNAGGTEAFEFEEMGDTYWTDRVIHNGGEEQTPPTEKENYQVVPDDLKPAEVKRTRRRYRRRQSQISLPLPSDSEKPADFDENAPAELIMNFSETDTIPTEKSLSKMFRHFGPIRDSQTEVDKEKNRARVVFRKGSDAEVAYKSAGKFNIFGTKAVKYELSFTITETFKVQPYVVSLGKEEAMLSAPS